MADFLGDEDIKCHIWSLPTWDDLEKFTTRVKKAFKEDITQLKTDTNQLGVRVENLEQRLDEALPACHLYAPGQMQHPGSEN